jgi:D-glycero-alpha-D-manno-heptose 1-phosphate guanylyltransferase
MMKVDEAIVLAGGLGTRLRGVVDDMPKPLAPVAGRPFVAWVLDALAAQGLRHAVLATGYLGEQVEATLGPTWRGMQLAYSREPEPRGTGGALRLALHAVRGDRCIVLNGDTWLTLDYAAFARGVHAADARLGVALAQVADVARYGAARLDGNRVTGFDEKGGAGPGFVNAGVYCVRRDLLDGFAEGRAFSFERDVLMPAAMREPVLGYTATRGFIDIGVPEDYRRAQALFAVRAGGTP